MTEPAGDLSYRFRQFELQPNERRLLGARLPAPLGRRAFDVLVVLVERAGQLVTKDTLLELVWPKLVVAENNLQTQISALRKVLGPEAIVTVSGRGYRFILEVTTQRAERTSATGQTKHNLPQQLSPFIGRERESRELRELFGSSRLVTLVGAGGIGKTRLAQAVGTTLIDDFQDGVWLVELAPLTDPQLVSQRIAAILEIDKAPGRSTLDTLLTFVKDRQLLLILDNCEHLIHVCADLAKQLLQSSRIVKLLATSREPLQVAGEATYLLSPLAGPDSDSTIDSTSLLRYEAVRFFVDRATAAHTRFRLTEQNCRAVAEVCQRLDGIPLALELTAARLRTLSIEAISERLDARYRLLATRDVTALPRHQTLRASIDWSYDLLTERERVVLQRLAIFVGGWTLEAAESVAAGGQIEQPEVADLLARLVEKSLVVFDAERCRYRMLETIRDYALEWLSQGPGEAAVRNRHCDYFAAMTERAEPALTGGASREQSSWLEKLDPENDNLRRALAWSLDESQAPDAALRLCTQLQWFWMLRADSGEGWKWCKAALDRSSGSNATPVYANALLAAGALAYRTGSYETARALAEQALTYAKALDDGMIEVRALSTLGSIASNQGDFRRAQAEFQRVLDICQKKGDSKRECRALLNLAWVALHQSELDTGTRLAQRIVKLSQDLDDHAFEARGLGVLREVAWYRGDLPTAADYAQRSLSIFRASGARTEEANPLRALAAIAAARGDIGNARSLWLDAFAATREHGEPSYVDEIAIVALALSKLHDAARFAGAADALREAFGLIMFPGDRDRFLECRDRCRKRLGTTAYQTAYETGRALTPNQVVNMLRAWLQTIAVDMAPPHPVHISDSKGEPRKVVRLRR